MSKNVAVLLFVAGHAIAKEAGKPARVIRKASSRLDQKDALALLPRLTGHDKEGLGGHLGGPLNEPAGSVESLGFQLVTEAQVRLIRNWTILWPHVDGVPAGVTECAGEQRRRAIEVDSLLAGDHAAYAKHD